MRRNSPAFHLAIAVTDLKQARHFYGEVLGCREGRSTPQWMDFDFFGHQLSLHLSDPGQDGGDVIDLLDGVVPAQREPDRPGAV